MILKMLFKKKHITRYIIKRETTKDYDSLKYKLNKVENPLSLLVATFTI